MIVLSEAEDILWIQDVHRIPVSGVTAAVVFGNEDCPDKVHLYRGDPDNVEVWERQEDMSYRRV